MTPPAQRERPLLAAALAVLTVVAGLYLVSGLGRADEAWFLQVVGRVADGDVLYRDVFFGATPLSVWLAWPLVALLGVQFAWVKLLVLAAFAATLVLVVRIARQLGASHVAGLLLAAATLVLATPYRGSLYQPLATVFLLACLSATLAWLARGRRERLAIAVAGMAAGLAFSTKQNVGLYALAALVGAVLLVGAGRRVPALVLAVAGFVTCALLPLVPVFVSGGFDEFADYAFANKGTYTDRASISYVDGFLAAADNARDHLVSGEVPYVFLPAYRALLYVLVPAALVLLGLAWRASAGTERRRVEVVAPFALAAAVAIFPRADVPHAVFVAPVIVVAGWYAFDVLLRLRAPSRARAVAIAAAVLLAPGVLVLAAWPALQVVDNGARLSDLPQARGILTEPDEEERLRETAATMSRVAADGSLFLALPDASLYYLLSGVENPTPFDYPLVTAFGRTGQDELADRIRGGGVNAVCLGIRRRADLAPRQLVRTVRRTMEWGERTPACRLYRFPAGQ